MLVSIADLEKKQRVIIINSNVIVELALDNVGFDREKNKFDDSHLYPSINVLCTKVDFLYKELEKKQKQNDEKYASISQLLKTNIEEHYKLQSQIDYFKTLVVFDTNIAKGEI